MKQMPNFSQYDRTFYENYNYGKGPRSYFMGKSHVLLEKQFSKNDFFENVIEMGSGVAYHLPYVRHKYTRFVMTDTDDAVMDELGKMVFPENIAIKKLDGGLELPYSDNTFDRLIASHVLEHIHHPEIILREWSRIVKKDGIISLALPCDPGISWRFGRMFGRKAAQKKGMKEYDLIMALQHVNPINVLIAIIEYFFPDKKEIFWPFGLRSIDLNFFYIVHIQNTKD